MTDRQTIAKNAAAGLRQFADRREAHPAMVGFDGFIDSIITVVDKRFSLDDYEPVQTIEQFGQKIVNASGMSSNYEFVVREQKLGGNGPIMSFCLTGYGLPLTYVGALGYPNVHPVFEDLNDKANVYSFSQPGLTDAVEFEDGKLMLGKHGTLRDVDLEHLAERIGLHTFDQLAASAKLIGIVNWTMLPKFNSIWEHLVDHLPEGDRRVFVDLADPEKRTTEDLLGAMKLCAKTQEKASLTLGLNLKESSQVAAALGIEILGDPEPQIEHTARAIRDTIEVDTVVIHPRSGAAAASLEAGDVRTASFQGPLVTRPVLSTGAGDSFNAGFCVAQLAGLPIDQALCAATASSGLYVRGEAGASLERLAEFCDELPAPAAN